MVNGAKPSTIDSTDLIRTAASPTRLLLHFISYVMNQDLSQRMEMEGVTVNEWKLLQLLYADTAVPPSVASAKLRLNSGTITKLADALIEKELLKRVENPSDRRGHPLSLTTTGRAKLTRLTALAKASDAAIFGMLSRKDHRMLDQILKILAERTASEAMRGVATIEH